MSAQERLRNIDVLSYELETDEMITAQLVKTYLSGLPEENALEIMRGVMKGSVIHLAAEEAEDEGQQDTEESRLVEGKQLAALIDTAGASIHRCLEEHMFSANTEEAKEARAMAIRAVGSISGKLTVENISPELLIFLTDCYRALRNQ